MAGGSEEDGFALETEVGLFAMKRDQVDRALKPFEDAGIEVDIVQLTPLAIYNYIVFDQMQDLPPADQYDPDNPPESVVVLSLGTDTTDLVITNGYRVWQRSIPIGGNHFTKALTKELKLTFAKAEHLKRNAAQAEDPKAVFQAMRPVFNDLVTEIQRSIGFFTSIDRRAKIGRVIALGNAMKLPGLQKYLSQNLGYAVAEVQKYRGLAGDAVVGEPGVQGEPAQLRRLLRAGACRGWAKAKLVDQSAAAGNRHRSDDPRQEAVGRGDGGRAVVGLHDQFPRPLAGLELGRRRQVQARARPGGQRRAGGGIAKSGLRRREERSSIRPRCSATGWSATSTVGCCGSRCSRPSTSACPPIRRMRSGRIEDRNEIHIDQLECEWFADLSTWYSSGVAAKIKAIQAPAAEGQTPPAEGAAADPAAPAAPPPVAAAPPPRRQRRPLARRRWKRSGRDSTAGRGTTVARRPLLRQHPLPKFPSRRVKTQARAVLVG